jgi:peptidoglycan LD-endopeptidase CwlK
MASKDINDLVPELRPKIKTLVSNCKNRGIEMRVYQTLRSPFEQARLWRQSRAKEEIKNRIKDLKSVGADFLAFCLESVGPQSGAPVTNAIPGVSWHQWAEAVDAFWVVNGTAEWSTTKKINGLNGYRVYAAEAEQIGLTAGGMWISFKDWPHVQLRAESSPLKIHTLPEISEIMRERFEDEE